MAYIGCISNTDDRKFLVISSDDNGGITGLLPLFEDGELC